MARLKRYHNANCSKTDDLITKAINKARHCRPDPNESFYPLRRKTRPLMAGM
jgi:hypothetical protein